MDDLHMVLWGISLTSIHQNQFKNADYYAKTHELVMKLFDLSDYTNYAVQLDITMARKDVNNGINILKKLLNTFKAINEPDGFYHLLLTSAIFFVLFGVFYYISEALYAGIVANTLRNVREDVIRR